MRRTNPGREPRLPADLAQPGGCSWENEILEPDRGQRRAHPVRCGQAFGWEGLGDGDAFHAGGERCLDPIHGILDDHALIGLNSELTRGGEEEVGGGLLMDSILGGDHGFPPRDGQPDAVEVGLDLDEVRAGGHREPEAGVPKFAGFFDRAREGVELGRDEPEVDFVGAVFGLFDVEGDTVFLGDAADVAVFTGAHEREEIVGGDVDATFPEHGDGGFVDERLGVGENAVHVEDHGLGFHDGGVGSLE